MTISKMAIYTYFVKSSELDEVVEWLKAIEPTGEKWSANGMKLPLAGDSRFHLIDSTMVMIFCSDLATVFKLTWNDDVISFKTVEVATAKS